MDLYGKMIAGLIGLVISLVLWVKAHKSHRNDCKALLTCIRKAFSCFSQSILQSICSSFLQLNGRFPALVHTTPDFISTECRPALSFCKSKRAGTNIYEMKSGVSFPLYLPKTLLTGALLVFIFLGSVNAATRTASVSGNWSNTATWGGAPVPIAGDIVIINSGVIYCGKEGV